MKFPIPLIFLGLCLSLTLPAQGQTAVGNLISVPLRVPHPQGHNFLLAAVKAANLDEILMEAGPFTVFAPSDAAFHSYANGNMEELLIYGDKNDLKALVSYHIVAGNLTASKILQALSRGEGRTSFTTVHGKKLWAHLEGSDIVLTDPLGNTAKITAADLSLENGVVHEIDRVILPSPR